MQLSAKYQIAEEYIKTCFKRLAHFRVTPQWKDGAGTHDDHKSHIKFKRKPKVVYFGHEAPMKPLVSREAKATVFYPHIRDNNGINFFLCTPGQKTQKSTLFATQVTGAITPKDQ